MTPQYITIAQNRFKYYFKDKQMTIYHREDGAAVEYPNGYKSWYINGERHREDGPAIEWPGYKAWFINGTRHREDGPAIEFSNGHKAWYLNAPEIVLTMDEIAAKLGIDVSKLKIKK